MRRILVSLCAILILLYVAGCSNNGVTPGTQTPTSPPPGTNPGGTSYQLQVTLDLSRNVGHAPLPVNMYANVIGGTPPYYFRWDVDGDGYWDYGGTGVSEVGIHYASPGLYEILLEVEDSMGQFYRANAPVDVKSSGPHAVPAAIPSSGSAPLSVSLDGSGSYDQDGYIVLWEWDFESDGVWDYESEDNPVAATQYSEQGTYNATLRVTDGDGLTDVASIKIICF